MKKNLIFLLAALAITAANGQKRPAMQFNKDGKFRIVQFTDIHHNPTPAPNKTPKSDPEEVIGKVLDAEKPDMVIFTGDIVTGKPDKDGWDKILQPVIDRKIPYTVTLGNHDDEYGDWNRLHIYTYLHAQPYSLVPHQSIRGKGGYDYQIPVNGQNGKPAAILYIMDSNAYSEIDGHKGWDYFAVSQVEQYAKASRALTRKNGGKPYPALAFFHIPVHEYIALFDTTKTYYKRTDKTIVGDRHEPECPGILNTGMFAAMVQAGDVMATFVGHDHTNNYIGYLAGIALAYGCNTGVWNDPATSGGRVIELNENRRSFDTWLRRAGGAVEHKVNYPQTFK